MTQLFDPNRPLSAELSRILSEKRSQIEQATDVTALDRIAALPREDLIEITRLDRAEAEFNIEVHPGRTHVDVIVPLVGSDPHTLTIAGTQSPAFLDGDLGPHTLRFNREFGGTPADDEIKRWGKSMVDQAESGIAHQVSQVQCTTDQWFSTDQPSLISRRRAELGAAETLRGSLGKGV